MKPRITLVTLGVDDLERAVAFYRDGLGFPSKGIVHDAGLPKTPRSATEVCLAHDVGGAAEVDAVMEQAGRAGARIGKPAAAASRTM